MSTGQSAVNGALRLGSKGRYGSIIPLVDARVDGR